MDEYKKGISSKAVGACGTIGTYQGQIPTPVAPRPTSLAQLAESLDWADPLLNGVHRINFYDQAGKQTYSACRPMVELKLTQDEAQALRQVVSDMRVRGEASSVIFGIRNKLDAKGIGFKNTPFGSFGQIEIYRRK